MTGQLPAIVTEAAGLVVMLDAAGRTIADLEHRVGTLERAVAQVSAERDALRIMLAEARATTDVPPTGRHAAENGTHDVTAAPGEHPAPA